MRYNTDDYARGRTAEINNKNEHEVDFLIGFEFAEKSKRK